MDARLSTKAQKAKRDRRALIIRRNRKQARIQEPPAEPEPDHEPVDPLKPLG